MQVRRSVRARWAESRLAGRKVMVGRDGWLFLQNDTNDYIRQFTGRTLFSTRELSRWKRTLESRRRLVEDLGVAWVCRVAPEKPAVYPEQLPPDLAPAPRRPVHQLVELANEIGAPVAYPVQDLESAKHEAQLYSRVDTHWNHRGALVFYRAVCADLNALGVAVEAVPDGAISWRPHEDTGDLGSKLADPITESTEIAVLREHRSRIVFDNRVLHHGTVIAFESAGSDAPTAVVIGESFTVHLLPFLKETFSRMVFVHSNLVDPTLLEHERPDVLISVPTERFLIRVPSDEGVRARLVAVGAEKRDQRRVRGERWFEQYLAGTPGALSTPVETVGTIPW